MFEDYFNHQWNIKHQIDEIFNRQQTDESNFYRQRRTFSLNGGSQWGSTFMKLRCLSAKNTMLLPKLLKDLKVLL